MYKKILLRLSALALCCIFTAPVLAQNRTISGTVTDVADGTPLPGVSVVVTGISVGTTSNAKGVYTLNVPASAKTISFSYVGYATREVPITQDATLNVALAAASNSLREVVVVSVGYGTLDKREVSSAITHVSSKDLLPVASNSPLMSLQGKVAGLSITNTAGADPNSSPNVQLRGVSSRNAGLGPLYVVNGVPGGNIDNINQNDIESIDVLKGGAASAIYGTRGSNGVIIITTKKGSSQARTFYEGYASFDYLTNRLQNLTPDEFIADRVKNSQGQDYGAKTNWMDAVTNSPAFAQKHTVQLSGGSGKTNYFASADYRNADGIDLRAHKKEYGARINVNHTSDNGVFIATLNIAPRYMNTKNSDQGNFNNALTLNPTYPIYDTAGKYNYINTGFFSNNPVENANVIKSEAQIKEMDINGSLRVNILKNLSTTVTVSEISRSVRSLNFTPSTLSSIVHAGKITQTNFASQRQEENDQKNVEWTGNYSFNLGRNHIKALGGYSYTLYNYNTFYAQNYDFPFDSYLWNNLGSGLYNGGAAGQGQSAVSSTQNGSTLISFFGRLNYDFNNRYILTASLRREGSSKFGIKNKWGNFPAVSGAWRVSEENFMKGALPWINDLKLRADYGITGNQDFDNYLSLLLYGGAGYFPYNGQVYQVYGPTSNVNPDLKWEKSINFNAGIDFSILDNRISGSLDYYIRKNKDLLGYYNVPLPPNSQSQTFANVGTMKNYGLELALNGSVIRNTEFGYNITAALAYNRNKFISFSNNVYKGTPFVELAGLPAPGSPGNIQRIQEGRSIGEFYTLRSAGVNKDGALQVYKKDGTIVQANQASSDDKQFVGNGLPKFTGSIGNTFRYKRFDMGIFLRGTFGYKIFNTAAFYIGTPSSQSDANVLKSAYNGKSKYSLLTNPATTAIASDYFLENGSFVKIDNVALGYTQPFKIKYLKSIRVYATGRNLHTFTGFTGGDPDLVNVNGLTPGVNTSLNYYPATLQLILGLQATF
ncbi:SusC/RagA family TonB-linked outer membrane protein [Mucilaginibacter ginsenosidivorax]|uniref:SusC/RagA family TonB-linked outer membrane protein n=1 Tax=Mucilaginibacter ginsenosidivorax TaxID=862126 RepID=A0A5B8VY53_9SPHI|nr:SusC/RagA family TonB-linked outer membrane protein [Mucilaginibacter ginsenosidivorax]QEC75218.1 SusC/RagA family TonB-linked outer membrane protein [Mucilaginibacter ginsenosidivorax]